MGSVLLLLRTGAGELLAEFLADDFADVPHALALVRFGLAELANFGGELADGLLVVALDVDAGAVGFDLDDEAFLDVDVELVGEAEGQDDGLALQFGFVTDALD